MCHGFQNEGKSREKEGEKKIEDLVSKRIKRKGLKRKNIRERERERERERPLSLIPREQWGWEWG